MSHALLEFTALDSDWNEHRGLDPLVDTHVDEMARTVPTEAR